MTSQTKSASIQAQIKSAEAKVHELQLSLAKVQEQEDAFIKRINGEFARLREDCALRFQEARAMHQEQVQKLAVVDSILASGEFNVAST